MSNPGDNPVPYVQGEPSPSAAGDGMQEYRQLQVEIARQRQSELAQPPAVPLPSKVEQ
jgi:hypothetical protein